VGPLAARVYGDPSSHVPVVAITGTNGKTTTATLLRHLLDHSYHPTGLCSTVHLSLGDQTVPSPRTTVEASVLQRICALGVERGIGALVVEVSSHAIALGRVGAMHFRSAGFTNMDHEHLDFHHTMDEYFETKAQLFTPAFTDAAVICVDTPWGVKLADRTEVETLSVSTTGVPADLMATDITSRDDGIGFQVRSADEQVDMFLPIPAAVMVQNAMVAIAMATQQGMDLATIADRLASAPSPDGRMVSIQRRTDTLPACIVDFAHTADALSRILTDVRATTPGKLWVIFGSDGERDWEKRPHMGRAVAAIADVVYVTDENPRFEDAAAIRHQILAGARAERGDDPNIVEFDNRAAAVRAAVLNAHPDDTVIATGKGNEEYQEIKGEKIPYYDGDVMRAALAERGGAQ
ncbi:MAG: UDP-N-acetylmuramoyl-L-alanyl-D-glutamate--2,6-diaminopimelate ligase, partial [Bowdeniella nasicola]|nr:UDP-N-acetylmuramoyl-L-alanyl-D-glutamate--2,6-diaminopimelate ligase [Bowdeniella nasicola]